MDILVIYYLFGEGLLLRFEEGERNFDSELKKKVKTCHIKSQWQLNQILLISLSDSIAKLYSCKTI